MSNCYCCVPQCRSWIKRNPELSFHVFPTIGKSKVFVNTEIGGKELVDRRKVWIQKLKMGKRVSNSLRVCSVHIERSNQRLKFFKVLSGKLNWLLMPMIEDIFIIICAVTNLSSPILADSRFLKN